MKVSVVIPVGPYPSNTRWLQEAVESAVQPDVDDILLIDDGADIVGFSLDRLAPVRVWKSPWRLGVGTAFNFGVALAKNECVFMLGSDDWLEPNCIEECLQQYNSCPDRDATYFYVPMQYDNGQVERLAANAVFVTKKFWEKTGGFPLVPWAPDAAFLEMLALIPGLGQQMMVGTGQPLYHHRTHPDRDTEITRAVNRRMGKLQLNEEALTLQSLMRHYVIALWKEMTAKKEELE